MSTGPHSGIARGPSLTGSAFPDDDGRPDDAVRDLLTRTDLSDLDVARQLRHARLLTSVVAVLDEVDAGGGDKGSHMAVVSMVNEGGERGLLAFTGTDSLATWSPTARPMPAWGRDVALAALEDGSAAVVIDVQGPARRVLAGRALLVLADRVDLPAVDEAVQSALTGVTADGWVDVLVEDARPDGPVDVLVTVRATGDGHPDGRGADALAHQVADLLALRPDIHALVPGGIGIAIAPS